MYDTNTVALLDVKTDDVVDYKKTAILLAFPNCFKYCRGCQNEHLRNRQPNLHKVDKIVKLYNRLDEHQAIVCAGLDPFDSLADLEKLIIAFNNNDKPVDFVIYTGYNYENVKYNYIHENMYKLITNDNFKLIIKYGQYDENNKNKYVSDILGVELIGDNQIVKEYCKPQ